MNASPAAADFRCHAFIAYSHHDEAWAKWLHKALETYRVPKRLAGMKTAAGTIPGRFNVGGIRSERLELKGARE